MKVKLRKEDRRWIPLPDMKIVRWIIEVMKDDNATTEYAESVVKLALPGSYDIDILRTEAHVCRNDNTWNAYADYSNNYDVWLNTHALTNKGFVVVGACLTDIWKITGRHEEDLKLLPNMRIRFFKEVTDEESGEG